MMLDYFDVGSGMDPASSLVIELLEGSNVVHFDRVVDVTIALTPRFSI